MAAARIQRWATVLAAYQYNVLYRSTNRLPLNRSTKIACSEAAALSISQIEMLPVSTTQLQNVTRVDPLLSKVMKYTQHGWPSVVPSELKPFHLLRYELTTEAGCLLWKMRVIIPATCQPVVLKELHTSHPAIVQMKSLAHIHVWWPSIDKHIESLVHSCEACQAIRNAPSTSELHPWAWPDQP